ncbi:MAG: hypothetical protein AABZ70_06470, partial [candidate division NC10 bacterium]
LVAAVKNTSWWDGRPYAWTPGRLLPKLRAWPTRRDRSRRPMARGAQRPRDHVREGWPIGATRQSWSERSEGMR